MCLRFHESAFQNSCKNERHYWQFDESRSHMHLAEKKRQRGEQERSQDPSKGNKKSDERATQSLYNIEEQAEKPEEKESDEEGGKGSRERERVITEIIATFGKEKERRRGSKEARRTKKK